MSVSRLRLCQTTLFLIAGLMLLQGTTQTSEFDEIEV
ncbi:hypothetical protein L905_25835 [Agrobacterium sp. TS43]|nr:hypothetical protein L905_25835 [Agrobacterium sp. TS43]KVK57514.1 hypothetical protein L906_27340 [Agrobacterium sp. TS45]KVK60228.1 hypothetical protein L907_27285 [Agrobacterium sp. C13]